MEHTVFVPVDLFGTLIFAFSGTIATEPKWREWFSVPAVEFQ